MTRLGYYLENRKFEWAMSAPVTTLGLMVLVWPKILDAPAFQLFPKFLSPQFVGLTIFMTGVACCVALLVNGASMTAGPRVRSITAGMRAVLWFQFSASTIAAGIEQGYPFTVTPFWIAFTFVEIYVAYRAVLDVRGS